MQTVAKKPQKPIRENADTVQQIKASRDAALKAAHSAILDTTRLTRLLTILSSPAPLEKLLDRVLSTLSELFSADIVVLLDPIGSGSYSPLAAIGLPEEMITQPFSHAEDSYTKLVMDFLHPVLLEGMDEDPRVDAQLRDLGVSTSIWLPVSGSSHARGVLILARCKPQPFVSSDANLLTSMTFRISQTLEQAQKSFQLAQLVDTGREIGSELQENPVFSRVVSRFPSLIRADAAALFLNDSGGKQKCAARKSIEPEWISAMTIPAEHFVSGVVSASTASFEISELTGLVKQFESELPQSFPRRSVLAIPIIIEQQVQGVLIGMRFTDTAFDTDTYQLAMLYESQASAAIQNARLYRSVQDELAMREQVGRALKASDERFRALIKSVSDVIAVLTIDGQITYISPAAEEAWDCPVKTLLSQNLFDRIHPDHVTRIRELFSALLEQPNETMTKTARLRQGDDSWRHYEITLTNLLNEPAVGGFVATFHDITERRTYERKLKNLAYNDTLTGLPNRIYFNEHLERALARCKTEGQKLAVVFLDLDGFKIVNDSMGHARGDHLLWEIADRLRSCLRENDSVARQGGDEFTILVEDVSTAEQVIPIVQRFISAFKEPVRLKDQEVFISGSFGIAISNPDDQVDDLLRKADIAMYQAKKQGKGTYAIFDSNLEGLNADKNITMRLDTGVDLHRAMSLKEFCVNYHPIVTLADRRIMGVDTSVQWIHPQRGKISPLGLLPLAVEAGIIPEFGKWFMNETFCQVRKWQAAFPLALKIKLRAQYLKNPSVLEVIKSMLGEVDIDPALMILEITDINLSQEIESLVERSTKLKELGLRIAVDEFGAGYSKLEFLQLFPMDILKLNLSYMNKLAPDPWKALAEGTIKFARSLGVSVIAEGIETEEQARLLLGYGCEYGEGDLFSPGLQPDEFEAILKTRFEKHPGKSINPY
jgi:diguanylate cyclase (GGDEF)-like protein/PAS domain S-box-containing protein